VPVHAAATVTYLPSVASGGLRAGRWPRRGGGAAARAALLAAV